MYRGLDKERSVSHGVYVEMNAGCLHFQEYHLPFEELLRNVSPIIAVWAALS
jgi:hypothetical protein